MVTWLNRLLQRGKQRPDQLRPKESKSELVVEDSALLRASSSSQRSILRTATAEAEHIAASIKTRARAEAEAEAERTIAQAKLEVQKIKGEAEIAAQKEAQDIVSGARKEAASIEVEAREKAFQFLVRTSQEIEKETNEEDKQALSRLSASLHELISESQKIDAEIKSKMAKLATSKSWALKEDRTALLGTSEASLSPMETPVMAEIETKPGAVIEEKAAEVLATSKTEAKPRVAVDEKLTGTMPPSEAVVEKKERKFLSLDVKIPWRREKSPVKLEEAAVVEKAGEPAPPPNETLAEKKEAPAPLPKETFVSAPAMVTKEERREERVKKQKEVGEQEPATLIEVDNQAVYTGEVELVVAPPVELKLLSQLYNYLQTVPELKVLYTRGSWDRGTTITVVLEKPVTLIKTIAEIPGMVVTAGLLGKDDVATGKSPPLLRGKEQGAKRLGLILEEAKPTK